MSKRTMLKERLPRYYWTIISFGIVFFLFVQPVSAADIWTQFTNVMKDIYTQLLAILTIVAVTASAVALIVRMISRNQRAVDEATS